MKRTFVIISACIVLFTHSSVAANQYDDTLKLLEITGSLDMGAQMGSAIAQQMVLTLKAARPDINPRAFTIIEEETVNLINTEMKKPGGLPDELIKIYTKYYSHQDIKDLLVFYQSNLGKKLIATMPMVMQESMMAGQNWGSGIGPLLKEKIDKRFIQEGIVTQ